MRGMKRATVLAAVAVLALGISACGDDDDGNETTATPDQGSEEGDAGGEASEGENAAFCDGLIEFNSAVNNVELDESSSEDDVRAVGEELAGLWAPISDNAPEDVADQVGRLDGVLEKLQAGDGEAFNSDETFATYTEVVDGAVESCGYETVDVTAVDYAFEDAPATVPAGNIAFTLTNASEEEEHEMIVFSKADGVTLSFDEILEAPEEDSESMVQFAAAAFAPPGGSGSALATLEPGDYMMVCFIPVGGGEDGPPHFTQGMKQEFTVE